MELQRVQKLIAKSGYCSRRKAEDLIKKGKVFCNSKIVRLGDKASVKDSLKIGKMKLNLKQNSKKLYFILNKPRGYVTTMSDEFNRKTVYDLMRSFKIKERLFPVGRLDLNTSGLLILTNDGEFANFVMHPKNKIEKTYRVTIKKQIKKEDVLRLQKGVLIKGVKTAKCVVRVVFSSLEKSVFLIKIHEGKKRQIRNMVRIVFLCEVKKLERIAIGELKLNDLEIGKIRQLSSKEVSLIKSCV